jgi:hypothetical protein
MIISRDLIPLLRHLQKVIPFQLFPYNPGLPGRRDAEIMRQLQLLTIIKPLSLTVTMFTNFSEANIRVKIGRPKKNEGTNSGNSARSHNKVLSEKSCDIPEKTAFRDVTKIEEKPNKNSKE